MMPRSNLNLRRLSRRTTSTQYMVAFNPSRDAVLSAIRAPATKVMLPYAPQDSTPPMSHGTQSMDHQAGISRLSGLNPLWATWELGYRSSPIRSPVSSVLCPYNSRELTMIQCWALTRLYPMGLRSLRSRPRQTTYAPSLIATRRSPLSTASTRRRAPVLISRRKSTTSWPPRPSGPTTAATRTTITALVAACRRPGREARCTTSRRCGRCAGRTGSSGTVGIGSSTSAMGSLRRSGTPRPIWGITSERKMTGCGIVGGEGMRPWPRAGACRPGSCTVSPSYADQALREMWRCMWRRCLDSLCIVDRVDEAITPFDFQL